MKTIRKTVRQTLWLSLVGLAIAIPSQALDDPRGRGGSIEFAPANLGVLKGGNIDQTWKFSFFPVEVSQLSEAFPLRMEIFDTLNFPQRLQRQILSLPFRPVQIGHPPRLPDDPELGVGLVLRLPFSF